MKHLQLIKTTLLSLACGACTSAPVHYYTLLPPNSTAEPGSAECCGVQIKRVLVPSEVDRPELVTRSGEDQAVILSNAIWLASLRDEIRDALSRQINLKIHEAAATGPLAGAQAPTVFVAITRFESVPAQYVLVAANWRIQRADLPKAATLTCETSARIVVGNGVSAAVQGYQQAIAKIANQMALDVLGIGRSAEPRCATH